MKKCIILLFFSVVFSSCEKDDLCDANTITTPRIVIEFYDFNLPANLKSVSGLSIEGIAGTNEILAPQSELFSGTKLFLPLRAAQDVTKYQLTLNSEVPTSRNTDFLEFNYSRNNVYVSRACGYKTLFELQGSPIVNDTSIPEDFWIKNIIVTTTKINDESETHIQIYF